MNECGIGCLERFLTRGGRKGGEKEEGVMEEFSLSCLKTKPGHVALDGWIGWIFSLAPGIPERKRNIVVSLHCTSIDPFSLSIQIRINAEISAHLILPSNTPGTNVIAINEGRKISALFWK